MMIILKFDGLFTEFNDIQTSSKNAGFMCYGWLLLRNERLIAHGHGGVARAQEATPNVAEYLALIEGLDALVDLRIFDEPVEIIGDAKCVIDQMRGFSSVNSPTIVPLYHHAKRLADRLEAIDWIWKPRRYNKEADWLTRHAMRKILADPSHYEETLKKIDTRVARQPLGKQFLHLVDLRVYNPVKNQLLPQTDQLSPYATQFSIFTPAFA